MRNKYSPIFNLNLYLIHSAICRRCREHIGKAIASREDSEKPSESSASRLVNQQYPPSEVFFGTTHRGSGITHGTRRIATGTALLC